MMALRGREPTEVKKRLKVLFYGKSGVGKTMAAFQFPKPYIIDAEGSSDKPQYIEAIKSVGGAVLMTVDFDETVEEIKKLLVESHSYKTVVIDSLTLLYNDLLEKAERKLGNEFGRHYGEANKHMKRLLNLLFRIDMNVIIISHSKNEYGANLSVLNQTFDCYKKLDYLFDLVIEVELRGGERVGIVKKSRIRTLEANSQFPFSYQAIADRYGKDIIEKATEIQELITREELQDLKHLIEVFKVPNESVDKWLDKAKASCIEEMPRAYGQKCIAFLKEQVKSTTIEVEAA
jgi:hypothetical protein